MLFTAAPSLQHDSASIKKSTAFQHLNLVTTYVLRGCKVLAVSQSTAREAEQILQCILRSFTVN